MTIVLLQCECGENLVLAVDTKTKQLVGHCLKCRKTHDILDVNLTDKDIENVEKSVHELKAAETDGMFYLRCTALISEVERDLSVS